MTDSAQHREADILAVWGEYPECPITGRTAQTEKAHILARGYRDGVGPKSPNRAAYSSILNFYPLPHEIHAGGYHDHRYLRALLLEIADDKVNEAVRSGGYSWRDEDAAFMDIRKEWFLRNFPEQS